MYKLNPLSTNDYKNLDTLTNQILKHNNVLNPKEYLVATASQDSELTNELLNMDKAVECFTKYIEQQSKITILVDCDTDGYTSAAIMYMYVEKLMKENNINSEEKLQYIIHERKEHGLSSDIQIPEDTNLLIIPDASSNDYKQHKELKNKGIDIIILDHHEAPKLSENAITVNNQLCDYPNKQLSGVGVVYKFLQQLDEYYWREDADTYIDLVALGLISDVMDNREIETRYYINKGLNNINNKLFQALLDKQSYSIKGIINPTNIAFYITPLVNAMIRVGSMVEKDMMFRAFCEKDEVFPYKKRGTDTYIDEDIYTRVARLCSNIKAQQKKTVDKQIDLLMPLAAQQKDNKVIFIGSNEVDNGLTGLAAIKLSSHFKRPVLLYKYNEEKGTYTGSGRSLDNLTIKGERLSNLKEFLQQTGKIKVEGHPFAFGIININNSKLDELKQICEQIDFDNTTIVDFIVPFEDLTPQLIVQLSQFQDYVGKGIEECKIAITDIPIVKEDIEILGTKRNTIKFKFEYFELIKFFTDESILEEFENKDTFTIVGKCSINEFNGGITPQVIIEEMMIAPKNV